MNSSLEGTEDVSVGVVAHGAGEDPADMDIVEVQSAGELTFQCWPAVRNRVTLEEPRLGGDLISATVSNFSGLHETLQSALDKSLQHSHNSVIALRGRVADIAERGNKEIHDALNSAANFATKIAKISEVIANRQRRANQKAAGCADDIMDAGQQVLTAHDTDQSFRGLARSSNIDNVNQQPDLEAIKDQVRGKVSQPAAQLATAGAPATPWSPTTGPPPTTTWPGSWPATPQKPKALRDN